MRACETAVRTGRQEMGERPSTVQFPLPMSETEAHKMSGNYAPAGTNKIDQQTKLPISIESLKVTAYKLAKGE